MQVSISLLTVIAAIVFKYFIFEKASEPGWQAIIPIWSDWILCKIAKKKWCFWVKLITNMVLSIALIGCIVLFGVQFINSFSGVSNSTAFSQIVDTITSDEFAEFAESNQNVDFENMTEEETEQYKKELEEKLDQMFKLDDTEKAELESELEASVDQFTENALTQFIIPMFVIGGVILLGALVLSVVNFIIYLGMSKSFGQEWYFAIGLTFLNLIFLGIMAFSDSIQYGERCTADEYQNAITPERFIPEDPEQSGEYKPDSKIDLNKE